jgi:multisubunit Na+/H+ antiporter MnhG subunit
MLYLKYMEIDISTPALLFSAISLLILAYTNRFLALANLIRQYGALYKEHPETRFLKQIQNFDIRLNIIKKTQIFGVVSFLFCVLCMFLIFVNLIIPAEILFAISLICLFISLLLSLKELFLSIGALNVELEDIKKEFSERIS